MIFSQTFEPADLGTIGVLVLLEGVLSVDNALVLGVLASRLPAEQAGKALRYGLAGAFVLRLVMVAAASFLLRWPPLKLGGGIYLAYLSIRHLFFAKKPPHVVEQAKGQFWWSVVGIELTDMAFAVDNILAAVALVGPPPVGWPVNRPHPKLWVILIGGMLGVILMRFAAAACVVLLRCFARLETCAYLIVFLVAAKLLLEWQGLDFQGTGQPAFWAFWGMLAACLAIGMVPSNTKGHRF